MPNEKLTFNDLPEVVGKLCERIESLENALKDNLAAHFRDSRKCAERQSCKTDSSQRKPACPHDRRGSMQLPWNIQVILLLQGQTRRDTCHQAGEASVRIPRRTGQMAGDRKKKPGASELRGGTRANACCDKT